MQDETGYFYYRKYPLITNKTPTLHWGQATMFAALALLERASQQQTNASAVRQTVGARLAYQDPKTRKGTHSMRQ